MRVSTAKGADGSFMAVDEHGGNPRRVEALRVLRRLSTHASLSATGVHYTLAPNSGGSGAVLALVHGAPGSARDFRHLVAAIGVRRVEAAG